MPSDDGAMLTRWRHVMLGGGHLSMSLGWRPPNPPLSQCNWEERAGIPLRALQEPCNPLSEREEQGWLSGEVKEQVSWVAELPADRPLLLVAFSPRCLLTEGLPGQVCVAVLRMHTTAVPSYHMQWARPQDFFPFYSKFKCTNVFYLYMTTSALQTQRNFNFLWSCKRNIHSGQHEAKKAPSQTIIYHNRTAWCWMRIIKFSVGSLKCHFHNQQLDSFATRDTNPPAATSAALQAEPFFPNCQPSTPNSSTTFSLPDFHLSSESLRYFGEHHPFFLLKYLR